MAGDWIKMRCDLKDDPAVVSIALELGIDDEDLVVGKLHKVWSWFDQQTKDGCARGVTETWLDRYTGVTGFARAMCNGGWLIIDSNGLRVPSFDAHNGKSGKQRALASRRMQRKRCATGATSAQPEKRREEKRDTTPYSPPGVASRARSLRWGDEVVDGIYAAYPRHTKPKPAKAAIRKALAEIATRNGDQPAESWLLARVKLYAEAQNRNVQADPLAASFIPHPATWFNAGSYDDDQAAWERRTPVNPNQEARAQQSREAAMRERERLRRAADEIGWWREQYPELAEQAARVKSSAAEQVLWMREQRRVSEAKRG